MLFTRPYFPATFRVQLLDAAGNPAGKGEFVSAADALQMPGANNTDADAAPVPILEAFLIPAGGNASTGVRAGLEYSAAAGVFVGQYTAGQTGRHALRAGAFTPPLLTST